MEEWSKLKKTLVIATIIIVGSIGVNTKDHSLQSNITNSPANSSRQTVSTPTNTATPVDLNEDNNTNTTSDSDSGTTDGATSDNTSTDASNLSNDNTYTNVDGTSVHSPAYSTNDTIPSGATAKCADGTYSFSLHHSGTCSHHGGVAQWL